MLETPSACAPKVGAPKVGAPTVRGPAVRTPTVQAPTSDTETVDGAVVGLLLAAGAGRRMGRPKALVHASDGSSWLRSSRARLSEAGCADVLTVLGAEADRAAPLLDGGWHVIAERWSDGMGESLRAGLSELLGSTYVGALVHLVDLPDVGSDAMRRVAANSDPSMLKRASYHGVPGHPVVIGRDHWPELIRSLHGDTGASDYLRRNRAMTVECGDLATGRDVDTIDGL